MICIVLLVSIWNIPTPEGLRIEAWKMFAIFIFYIASIVLNPYPMGVMGFLTLAISIFSGLIDEKSSFDGFAYHLVWLVVFAYFISESLSKTKLGKRLAYNFIKLFGKKTIGLAYALAFADCVLAPAIPSIVARSAGILMPVVKSISESFDSYPNGKSSKLIGSYLMMTSFQASVISSSMFMTAMAGNILIADLLRQHHIELTWVTWTLAGIVPGLLSLLIMPLLVYYLNPPVITSTPKAQLDAKERLAALGAIEWQEIVVILTIILLIGLWIGGKSIGLSSSLAALIGLLTLLISRVLQWDDLTHKASAWDTFIWFSIILVLIRSLDHYGLFDWYLAKTSPYFSGFSWEIGFPILCACYFYIHYFFASCTAHISVLFIPCLLLSISIGTPTMLAVLMLTFLSNLFGCLTHYSVNTAPLYFANGYNSIESWWRIGFILSVCYIAIYAFAGVSWWMLLGYF